MGEKSMDLKDPDPGNSDSQQEGNNDPESMSEDEFDDISPEGIFLFCSY